MNVRYEIKKETPTKILELIKMAGDKTSWRKRLDAVNELKKYDCKQSREVLTQLALHDLVFKVKEAALKAAHPLGITKNGRPLRINGKPKGNLIKDIDSKLYKVEESLEEGFEINKFKNKFKQLYPEEYDVYQYDKENKFDEWIINVIKNK